MMVKVAFLVVAFICIQGIRSDKLGLRTYKYDPKDNQEELKSLKSVKRVPIIVESNLTPTMEEYALKWAQDADYRNLLASEYIRSQMVQTFGSAWNVAVNPDAFYVDTKYFAHYLARDEYNVLIYSVNC